MQPVYNLHIYDSESQKSAQQIGELDPIWWFIRSLMLLANLRRIDFVEKRGILEPVRIKPPGG